MRGELAVAGCGKLRSRIQYWYWVFRRWGFTEESPRTSKAICSRKELYQMKNVPAVDDGTGVTLPNNGGGRKKPNIPDVQDGSVTHTSGHDKSKHLEMIQGIISRLASNSFSIKQWTVMFASALLVLVAREGPELAAFALVPVLAFWCLDGYYLRQERSFRRLYRDVCKKNEGEITFSMNASSQAESSQDEFSIDSRSQTYFRTLRSRTLVLFYGAFTFLFLIVLAVVAIPFFSK